MGKFFSVFVMIIAAGLFASGCGNITDTKNGSDTTDSTGKTNTGTSAPPSFETRSVSAPAGSEKYDLYLLKINKGSSIVGASETGTITQYKSESDAAFSNVPQVSASQYSSYSLPQMRNAFNGGTQGTCYEPAHVQEFNSRPYDRNTVAHSSSRNRSVGPSLTSYTLNTTKQFWVQDAGGVFVQKWATLHAQGTYGNVWIANGDTYVTKENADNISAKFDMIYGKETAVLGYEYGGGPGGTGGADGDPRVQILVYDIDYDSTGGGTVGYFWGKDEYPESTNFPPYDYKSNACEIFYIDSVFTKYHPDVVYSTLAHEFQHMIHFNQKNVQSSTWYNEMLSLMTEDVISPFIGLDVSKSGHPVKTRIPFYLSNYNSLSLTTWEYGVADSYSSAFAFCAYLARNFGGANLLSLIEKNDLVDEGSITKALKVCTQNTSDIKTFDDAFKYWGEALIYTEPSADNGGKFSFNNTVKSTIAGIEYTYDSFDISQIDQYQETSKKGLTASKIGKNEIPSFSFDVQISDTKLRNLTGTTTVKLEKPANSNVELILYAVPVVPVE
ncbi:MAG: hypothetical protein Ta2F_13450 [Termitinemataceae bacterium]|nr:MAG: hypothetical protein Ta2F_13450 [Termitinemataceae bacterium]